MKTSKYPPVELRPISEYPHELDEALVDVYCTHIPGYGARASRPCLELAMGPNKAYSARAVGWILKSNNPG